MVQIVVYLLHFLTMIVFVDALLSWVMPDPRKFPRSATRAITAPMYAPIHAIIDPRTTGLDFSPIVLIMFFNWIARMLQSAA
ncbi:MAG: YggT family protein [Alphaproteobacteria bacterium]|nr:YggT family protein [Alphaproteobacteria bacterium]